MAAGTLLGALAAAGCGLGPGPTVGDVRLTVTRDYGSSMLLRRTERDAQESETVLRLLDRSTQISTRYGGGFVEAIEGVEGARSGGRQYDWFFYVNGVESPVGAAEVSLQGGEQVWWDMHNWGATAHVPAVVGSWPAPFTTGWEGHRPTVVVDCEDGGKACGSVRDALEGEGVKIASGSPKGALTVLVGPWAKIRTNSAAALIENGPGESGVYAEFAQAGEGWELVGLDEDGEKARTFGPEAGLVAATRHFEGPPVWVVTGRTPAAVESAAEALDGDDLRDHYAVESEAGAATPLPLRSER
jgi:Domain of unknown function (DUF4430)